MQSGFLRMPAVAIFVLWVSSGFANAQQPAATNVEPQIPSPLETFELPATDSPLNAEDRKKIVLDGFIVSLPEDRLGKLWSLAVDGSSEIHRGKHPDIKPLSSALSVEDGSNAAAMASTQLTTAWPVRTAAINEEVWKQLRIQLKSSVGMNVSQLPSAVVLDGQSASINDTQRRTFVVDVDEVKSGSLVAHQPILQLFDDGSKFIFQAEQVSDGISLRGDLAFCEVESVQTFSYTDFSPPRTATKRGSDKTSPSAGVMVQVPTVRTTTAHFASVIEEGNAVMVDPMLREESQTSKITLFGKKQTTQTQRLILVVFPKLVSVEEVASR